MMNAEPRKRRAPWRALSIATTVAVGLIGLFVLAYVQPLPRDCWEWCGLGRIFALAGISVVCFAWLAAFLGLAWRHRASAPEIAVLSAVSAAALFAGLAVLVIVPWSPDSHLYVVFQLLSLVGIGVALPAGWRIARQWNGRWMAGLAAALMAVSVAAGIAAYLALGTTWWTPGPTVQELATIGWSAALSLLVIVSWAGPVVVRASLSLLMVGAALVVGIGVLALGFHVSSGGFVVTPLIALAAGWGLLAFAWGRGEDAT